jgi:hypothetical protein
MENVFRNQLVSKNQFLRGNALSSSLPRKGLHVTLCIIMLQILSNQYFLFLSDDFLFFVLKVGNSIRMEGRPAAVKVCQWVKYVHIVLALVIL